MSVYQSGWVFDVNEADFEAQVLDKSREKPVVVDFWSPRCGPCKMLTPLLEQAVAEHNGEVLLAKLNTDDNQQLAMLFRIDVVPTVIAFQGGEPVSEFTGLLAEAQIGQFFQQLLPSEAEKLMRQAAAMEATDPEQAERLYRLAFQKDDRLEQAQVGLARALAAQKKTAEAAQLLESLTVSGALAEEVERLKGSLKLHEQSAAFGQEAALRQRLEAEPDNAELRYELGCTLAAAGQHEEALEMLLSAGQRDPNLARSKVREAMVNIFHVVGGNSALANEYRQKLTLLLY